MDSLALSTVKGRNSAARKLVGEGRANGLLGAEEAAAAPISQHPPAGNRLGDLLTREQRGNCSRSLIARPTKHHRRGVTYPANGFIRYASVHQSRSFYEISS